MKDDFFFDFAGEPLTGKIPLQVRFFGAGDRSAVRGPANAALRAFLTNARLSLADTLRKTVPLPGGGEMRMYRSFGTTIVDIRVGPDEEEDVEPFYGGILLRPQYLPNETPFLTSTVAPGYSHLSSLVVYDEVKTNGSATEEGRPAFPGTPEEAETDWLVIRIVGDRPLGTTPVRSGTVMIYRTDVLNVGELAETRNTPEKYLLSMDVATGAFYLGNKVALNIPTAPLTVAGSWARGEWRLRTFKLSYKSLEEAAGAEGIVILTGRDGSNVVLFAVDTRNRPVDGQATWQQLAEVPFSALDNNDFGFEFDEVSSPDGSTTISCRGSNGAGVCSSFEVRVVYGISGPPTLTGEISTMGSGYVPAKPAVVTVSRTINIVDTATSVTATRLISGYGSGPDGLEPTYAPVQTDIMLKTIASSAAGSYVGPIASQVPDKFLGGFFPAHAPSEATWSYYHTNSMGAGEWRGRYSVETLQTYFGTGPTQVWEYENEDLVTFSAAYSWNNQYVEQSLSHFYSQARSFIGKAYTTSPDEPFLPDVTVAKTPAVFNAAFEFVPDPIEGARYWGKDVPTETLALRLQFTQTGRCLDTTITTAGRDTYYDMTPTATGPACTIARDDAVAALRVVNRANEAKHEFLDLFSLFPIARPAWSKAGSETSNVTHMVSAPPADHLFGPAYANALPATTNITYVGVYPALYVPPLPEATGLTSGEGFVYVDSTPEFPLLDFTLVYSYGGTPFSQVGTPTEIAGIYGDSYYAKLSEGVIYDGEELLYPPQVTVQQGFPTPPASNIGTIRPKGGLNLKEGAIYLDPRTGGYIANATMSIWANSFGSSLAHAVVAVIGNKFGAIPLQPVIDEWRRLGEVSEATEGKTAFVNHDYKSLEVTLLI